MVNQVRVRPATREDLSGLVSSSDGLFTEDAGTRDPTLDLTWPAREAEAAYANMLDSATSLVLVVDGADAGVVGHLLGRIGEPVSIRPIRVATLTSMYVRPEYRNSGVGGELVQTFLAWARENGADRAAVSAYAANEDAIRFYQRNGFAPYTLQLEQPL